MRDGYDSRIGRGRLAAPGTPLCSRPGTAMRTAPCP